MSTGPTFGEGRVPFPAVTETCGSLGETSRCLFWELSRFWRSIWSSLFTLLGSPPSINLCPPILGLLPSPQLSSLYRSREPPVTHAPAASQDAAVCAYVTGEKSRVQQGSVQKTVRVSDVVSGLRGCAFDNCHFSFPLTLWELLVVPAYVRS